MSAIFCNNVAASLLLLLLLLLFGCVVYRCFKLLKADNSLVFDDIRRVFAASNAAICCSWASITRCLYDNAADIFCCSLRSSSSTDINLSTKINNKKLIKQITQRETKKNQLTKQLYLKKSYFLFFMQFIVFYCQEKIQVLRVIIDSKKNKNKAY